MVHPVRHYGTNTRADTRESSLTQLVRLLPVTDSGLPNSMTFHFFYT